MNDQGRVGAEGSVSDIEASSAAVDHALLESLFYNEMMMLNPSSPGPTFLSHHISEATQFKPQQAEPSVDPNTFVEKEILRDFGVSASPVRTSTHQLYAPQEGIASTSHVSQSWDVAPAQHPQHIYIAPAGPVPDIAPKHAPTDYATHHAPHGNIYRSYPPETAAASQPASSYEQRPPLSVDTCLPPLKNVPRDRTKMLVDQFATLANRLGIDLPNNVLQSLTAAAAKNGPGLPCATLQSAPDDPTSSLDLKQPVLDEDSSDSAGPSTLHELRKTAEEAIASVTKKRPLDTEDVGNGNGVSRHGKRKKKPRLADCESRLAELRAENDLLKRHLENVSNKAHRFDQEKEAAGKRIHALLEQNAGQEEMNAAVREFSEMYSDYGKNRQNELHFHLEQLQRYVRKLKTICIVSDCLVSYFRGYPFLQACQSYQLYQNGALDAWAERKPETKSNSRNLTKRVRYYATTGTEDIGPK